MFWLHLTPKRIFNTHSQCVFKNHPAPSLHTHLQKGQISIQSSNNSCLCVRVSNIAPPPAHPHSPSHPPYTYTHKEVRHVSKVAPPLHINLQTGRTSTNSSNCLCVCVCVCVCVLHTRIGPPTKTPSVPASAPAPPLHTHREVRHLSKVATVASVTLSRFETSSCSSHTSTSSAHTTISSSESTSHTCACERRQREKGSESDAFVSPSFRWFSRWSCSWDLKHIGACLRLRRRLRALRGEGWCFLLLLAATCRLKCVQSYSRFKVVSLRATMRLSAIASSCKMCIYNVRVAVRCNVSQGIAVDIALLSSSHHPVKHVYIQCVSYRVLQCVVDAFSTQCTHV